MIEMTKQQFIDLEQQFKKDGVITEQIAKLMYNYYLNINEQVYNKRNRLVNFNNLIIILMPFYVCL